MAEFPAMPLWTDAYLGDTGHLTTIEHGAYLLLLMTAWRTKERRLPDDDRMLARYARLTPGQWRRIKPVIEPFFDVENGYWTQGRLTDEANAVRQHSRKQSDKAKSRWLKNKGKADAAGVPEGCRTDASLTLTLTHTQDESNDSSERDEFEEWYQHFPRKVAKGAARKAFKAARKKADLSALIAGAKSYAASVAGKDAEFIAHPATWLNAERWLDAEKTEAPASTRGASLERRVDIARSWLSRNDSIPDWMNNRDVADVLLEEGHDHERLRKAGFSLPPLGKVVDISDAMKRVKIGG